MSEKKIGIMGGTFNPVHNGHLILAENAFQQYHLDKVYFMPAGIPPHKRNSLITSGEIRCEMVNKAIAHNPAFGMLDIEVSSKETSYTYRTLEQLQHIFLDTTIYFIMGADSLSDFAYWKNPQRISELCKLLVAVRDDLDQAKLVPIADQLFREFHTEVHLLNTPNISISSRDIRNRIQKEDSIRYLVPEEVREYIITNHLYLDEE
jgi:nicotinate-nucleotide adenylyltransferase